MSAPSYMGALPAHLQERIWRMYHSNHVLAELVRATRYVYTLHVAPCETGISYNDIILDDIAHRGPVEATVMFAADGSLVGGAYGDILLSLPCDKTSPRPPAYEIDCVSKGEVVATIPECDLELQDVAGEDSWTCAWLDEWNQNERFYRVRVQRLGGLRT